MPDCEQIEGSTRGPQWVDVGHDLAGGNRTFEQSPGSGPFEDRLGVVYGHFTDRRDSLLMGFSDEEIEADRAARAKSEADRDDERRSSRHIGPTETCLHCHRPFPAHEATSINYPICTTCLD